MDGTPSILQRVQTTGVSFGIGLGTALLLVEGSRLLISKVQPRLLPRKPVEPVKPPQATNRISVAFLVDGENISPAAADFALDEAKLHGEVTVKRVFGCCDLFHNNNLNNKKNWKDACLRLDLEQFHLMRPSPGKNTADIALAVNAIELAKDGICNCFCIVTSDSDFTPLVRELRALRCKVIIIGKAESTPKTLQEACNKYVSIDHLSVPMTPTRVSSPLQPGRPAPITSANSTATLLAATLVSNNDPISPAPEQAAKLPASAATVITQAYMHASQGGKGDWVPLSKLGQLLHQYYPAFKATTYAKDLSALIQLYDTQFELRKRLDGHPEMRLKL